MESIEERIAQAIEHSGKSQRKIALAIGVSPQALNKWLKTGNAKKELLVKFSKITGVNFEWLVTGLGDMTSENYVAERRSTYNDYASAELESGFSERPLFSILPTGENKAGGITLPDLNEKTLRRAGVWDRLRQTFSPSDSMVDIPYYRDVHFSAGNGCAVDGEDIAESLAFQKKWLDKMGLSIPNLVVVRCRGDSMEPRLCDGDAVLVNCHKFDYKSVSDGAIYAINYGGEARIKRLIKRFDGSLVIRSDNKNGDYQDEIVDRSNADQLLIIGQAVWVGGLLF
mgnify:CR=1 FL=1|jgi:phage repressor protein C with HTH and peptisase S24 domain